VTVGPLHAPPPQFRSTLPSDAGAPGNEADEGFAQLLANLLALGAKDERRGTATATSAPYLAEIFNEDGFFHQVPLQRTCAGGPDAGPAAPADAPPAVVPARIEKAFAQATVDTARPEVAREPAGRPSLSAAAAAPGSRPQPTEPFRTAAQSAPPRGPAVGRTVGPNEPVAAFSAGAGEGLEARGGQPRAAARSSPPPAPGAAGATPSPQLSLRVAEAEASIVARVQALTREERARLRSEIVHLLARYGLSAADLRLNGEAGPFETV
jgi:hypothetical protein